MGTRIFKVFIIGFVMVCFLIPTVAFSQEKGPIKIGFIATVSGPFAQLGKDMLDGANLYLEEHNSTMAGRKIDLIVEDEAGAPAVALTKIRKFVEMNNVAILFGLTLANSGYAAQPYIDSKRVPTVLAVVAGDDITQRKRSKWIIRTGWAESQPSHPLGEYAYKVLGYRKLAVMGIDFAYGWETTGGFQRTFEESGGKIIQKMWCPTTTVDFSAYLPQISKEADAVFATFGGKFASQLLKQFQDFGLKGKIPIFGTGTLTDETILPSMGDEALGLITALHYSAALDTPVNKEFVKKYRAKFGKLPSYYSENSYTGMRLVDQAISSLKGDLSNGEKIMQALQSVNLQETPRGPIKFDSYGNPVENIYIRKVERVGGELQNTVIYTYPEVSQFWKYNPEEFLKQPVYSRDYPPLKP